MGGCRDRCGRPPLWAGQSPLHAEAAGRASFAKNLGGEKSHPDAGLDVGQLEVLGKCGLRPAARAEPLWVREDPALPCSACGTCSLSFKAPSSPSASLLTLKG